MKTIGIPYLLRALAIPLLLPLSPALCQITDDFESYAPGIFPGPDWLDAGLIDLEPPNPPDPSVIIVETTDATGSPTRALSIVDALAPSQGIYQHIPISARYIVSADVRVDRFSDMPATPVSDWAVEVGIGQFIEGVDLCCSPQVGIYASSATQGWRMFVVGASGTFVDIDLELPVDLGRWYSVETDLDAVNGVIRSRILDAATHQILVDRIDQIEGWTGADGPFDLISIFDGELGPDDTIANLAVVDNVRLLAVEPICRADLNDDGVVDVLDFFAFIAAFAAGCP